MLEKHSKEEREQIKQDKKQARIDKKHIKEQQKQAKEQSKALRKELIGQLNLDRMQADYNKHTLSTKEKQNELLKWFSIVALVICTITLTDSIKSILDAGDTVNTVGDILITEVNPLIEGTKLNLILNELYSIGKIAYPVLVGIKNFISNGLTFIANIISIIILLISRACLSGKENKLKKAVSMALNVICLVVLFNLVAVIFELNFADMLNNLKTSTLLTVLSLIKKLSEAALFIVEMGLIIKYTFFIVKVPNKGVKTWVS